MAFCYAQISAAGVVVAVSELSCAVEAENLVPIDIPDSSLVGMVWVGDAFLPAEWQGEQ